MPITALAATAISLLPKIPEIWESVASLFGKETPKVVKDAAKLRDVVMGEISSGDISPDKLVELEKISKAHEVKMQELLLQEKALDQELEIRKGELSYGELQGQKDLESVFLESDDEYVRRTRPWILRKLFIMCCGYTLYAPLVIVAIILGGAEAALVTTVVSLIEWMGGWLFGTFAGAFLGYTAARTVDKRNPDIKNGTNLIGKLVNKIVLASLIERQIERKTNRKIVWR